MALLTVADHDAIRGAIDARLGARDLSDALIATEIYRPAAEAAVVARVPDYASRTPAEQEALRRAAIYLCAAALCPVAPVMQSETISRWSGTRAGTLDPEARARELRALAEAELSMITTGGALPGLPFVFGLARGRARY